MSEQMKTSKVQELRERFDEAIGGNVSTGWIIKQIFIVADRLERELAAAKAELECLKARLSRKEETIGYALRDLGEKEAELAELRKDKERLLLLVNRVVDEASYARIPVELWAQLVNAATPRKEAEDGR